MKRQILTVAILATLWLLAGAWLAQSLRAVADCPQEPKCWSEWKQGRYIEVCDED